MAGPGPTPSSDGTGRSWGLVALTIAVVAALAAPIAIAAVARLTGGSDGPSSSAASAAPSSTHSAPPSSPPTKPSTKPSARPSARSSTATPTASPASPSSPSSRPSSTTSPSPGGATCWDGSAATSVADCTEPQGEAGLRYVFPSAGYEHCGHGTTPDQPGLVLRLLCHARLADGTQVVIGYAEWDSVTAAARYFEDQNMQRADVTDASGHVAIYQFVGREGSAQKVAGLFAHDPFSVAVEVPLSTDVQQAIAQVVTARPAELVRGQPNP